MKFPGLEKWDLVEVVWNDAFVDSGALNSDDFVNYYNGCVRRTLGYFLGFKDERVFIAETNDLGVPTGDGNDCERITVIPFESVVHLIKLSREVDTDG